MLQFEYIHEMFRGLALGGLHFGKFQRTTQVGPSSAAIDDRLYAQTGVDVLVRSFPHRRGCTGKYIFCENLTEQRRRSSIAYKISSAEIGYNWHSEASI